MITSVVSGVGGNQPNVPFMCEVVFVIQMQDLQATRRISELPSMATTTRFFFLTHTITLLYQ